METVFAGAIEVLVIRNGREVDRVVRPLRRTPHGPVVKYKRRLWAVQNNSINVSGRPLCEDDVSKDEEQETAQATGTSTQPLTASSSDLPVKTGKDVASIDVGQSGIIDADSQERLLVDAGPGTGKTHTACLKVAALIKGEDIPPSRIWMISFTRTAVHEIRNRLTTLLESATDAASVRVATLDSLAWTIHSGFSKDAVLTGSYDDNINQTLSKIRDSAEVREEFEKIRHVIVDEAQDIVGVRAELVIAIIDAVDQTCGVTVFADQAQAIYGFTEDEDGEADISVHLIDALEDRDFTLVNLTEIHRTDSPKLLGIFRDVRRKVLDNDVSAFERGTAVRAQIEKLADANLGSPGELKFAVLPASALVLMRQRSEVLTASSLNQDTPHRLRMSGLPVRILPWPSVLLWDHQERRLTKDAFVERWQTRAAGSQGAPTLDGAWQLLYETAGEKAAVIDLHRLRHVLGRSNPPAAFTSPEYGDLGPIVGTIHASKGREAEEVFLYLPPLPEEDDKHTDLDEEVRVYFVGATRARKRLSVGCSSGRRLGNVDGRFWKKMKNDRVQVEIGRPYDIDAKGLVGRTAFSSAALALEAQEYLLRTPVMKGMNAQQERELGWAFALETSTKVRLGILSEKVNVDMQEIARRCESWPPPNSLWHIRSLGLRSLAVRADDSVVDQLHEPWRTSGFLFAPMLLGVCLANLRG
jgi:hypothetical protein